MRGRVKIEEPDGYCCFPLPISGGQGVVALRVGREANAPASAPTGSELTAAVFLESSRVLKTKPDVWTGLAATRYLVITPRWASNAFRV